MMTLTSIRFLSGFALSAAVVFSAFSTFGAESLDPVPSATVLYDFQAARCSRPVDQQTRRIQKLVEFVETSRSMAEDNPLLWAEVGYYEAELAASRRCLQAVAGR